MSGGDDLGAYGFRVRGLEGAAEWMQPVPAGSPELVVTVGSREPDDSPSSVDDRACDISLIGGGRLVMRHPGTEVFFALPTRPPDGDLLHPYLAPAAALAHVWAGNEALHGGGFIAPSGMVIVLGRKEAGKSTTLESLAVTFAAGVMADDLIVIEGGRALAGPRSLDLRASDAPSTAFVREGGRRRLHLEPVPPHSAIAGTVVLEPGDRLAVTTIPPAERVEILAGQRMYYRLAGDPQTVLGLASLPMYRMTRPHDRGAVADAAERLLSLFDGH